MAKTGRKCLCFSCCALYTTDEVRQGWEVGLTLAALEQYAGRIYVLDCKHIFKISTPAASNQLDHIHGLGCRPVRRARRRTLRRARHAAAPRGQSRCTGVRRTAGSWPARLQKPPPRGALRSVPGRAGRRRLPGSRGGARAAVPGRAAPGPFPGTIRGPPDPGAGLLFCRAGQVRRRGPRASPRGAGPHA